MYVVRMGMGKEYGVQTVDARAQGLQAEFRASVHEQAFSRAAAHEDR